MYLDIFNKGTLIHASWYQQISYVEKYYEYGTKLLLI
jgi:hypothetical protein